MKNDEFIRMDIDELKTRESELINFLKYSNEHLSTLFKEQLELARQLTDEKKINDDLRDRIRSIQIAIEVKEEFAKPTRRKS